MLTNKQIQFCNEYYKSGNIRESYLKAYNSESAMAASVEGSKLLKRDDIQEYIKTLNKPIIDNIQNYRQTQIQFIQDRINISISNNDESSIIKYTDMLNKLYGLYKSDNITQENKENIFNSLTTNELKNILN